VAHRDQIRETVFVRCLDERDGVTPIGLRAKLCMRTARRRLAQLLAFVEERFRD
jgi:hypothetical protein